MKIPDSLADKPEAARALAILEGLDGAQGAQVFEAFEALDDLPADIVRAVLTTWTGPVPDAALLDPALRRAHRMPALPLALRCARVLTPSGGAQLGGTTKAQVRQAGVAWDGRDLSADLRLAKDGSESSFAGTLQIKTFVDARGKPVFDVVLHGAVADASGVIFGAGSANAVGAVAYGIVELEDRPARVGLQNVLAAEPDPAAAMLVIAETPSPVAAPPAIVPEEIEAPVDSIAETPRLLTRRQLALFDEEEPETIRSVPPPKKVAAKKTAAKTKTAALAKTAKRIAAKAKAAPVSRKTAGPVSKKTAAKAKAAPVSKKPVSKKTAGPVSKKTAAKAKAAPVSKKPVSKKTAAPVSKKTAAPVSKKTAPVSKKAAAPASKTKTAAALAKAKAAAKKAPAKKTAAKKAPAKSVKTVKAKKSASSAPDESAD